MHDAHFHLNQDGSLPDSKLTHGIISTRDKRQFVQAQRFRSDAMLVSFGLHPWYAYASVEAYMDLFQQCDLIGEIGLDRVWSTIELEQQISIFESQLQLAMKLNKAVVLHTKGCEQMIAKMIRNYPNTYLVHWYSCNQHIEEYIAMDCYFTIGPSVVHDEVVQACVKQIPLDRLLLESDGMEAIEWAVGKVQAYELAMKASLEMIAKLRKIKIEQLALIIDQNFKSFIQKVVI